MEPCPSLYSPQMWHCKPLVDTIMTSRTTATTNKDECKAIVRRFTTLNSTILSLMWYWKAFKHFTCANFLSAGYLFRWFPRFFVASLLCRTSQHNSWTWMVVLSRLDGNWIINGMSTFCASLGPLRGFWSNSDERWIHTDFIALKMFQMWCCERCANIDRSSICISTDETHFPELLWTSFPKWKSWKLSSLMKIVWTWRGRTSSAICRGALRKYFLWNNSKI